MINYTGGSIRRYCNEHKLEFLCSVMTMAIEHPSRCTTSWWCSRRPCYLDGLRFHARRRCCCFFGCLPSVSEGSYKWNGAPGHASVLHPCNSGSNTWDGPGIWRSSAKVWGPGQSQQSTSQINQKTALNNEMNVAAAHVQSTTEMLMMMCQPSEVAIAMIISYHLTVGDNISAYEMWCVHFNFATIPI